METYLLEWANLLLRWLHLIVGIAWIGASFYFVMLDNSLKLPSRSNDAERGVSGELWAVHGGGFYCSQKFPLGPRGETLTPHLHWSKWEAYSTWLSGMALLAVIYWAGASNYLIDAGVMALSPPAAITASVAFLAAGWLVYDALCRRLMDRDALLGLLVFLFVMAGNWALHQIFSARAAYIHVGAMLGTMMVANVFFHIIPGQKRMEAQIRAGEAVDPHPGRVGKQRSVHNTYFTLPVLFTMISNHYPMTYSNEHGWLVLAVLMLAGVLIRQFFVLCHRGQIRWWLPAAGAAMTALLIVLMAPKPVSSGGERVGYAALKQVVGERCVACHAASPSWDGFAQPPRGVMLETAAQIGQHGPRIAETVANGYMPLGNLTAMTDEERTLVARWFAQGASLED